MNAITTMKINDSRELRILSNNNGDGQVLISAMMRLCEETVEYSEENSSNETISVLESLLDNDSPQVRRCAAITLGKLKLVHAVPLLMHACRDREVQGSALHALRIMGVEPTTKIAVDALQNGNEEARREAILVLEKSGGEREEIIEELRKISRNGNEIHVRMAQRALKRLQTTDR